MDSNNKFTNGWILCPSKSFPGKFYYFNVTNGATAWCLNEAEKKSLKRDINIQKIANESHSYPEPTSPPIENIPNSTNIGSNIKKSIPNISQSYANNTNSYTFQHPTPMFSQAIFPKSLSSQIPCIPNIFWTPIQIPVPMFVAPEPEKLTTDQTTQTFELDRELFVQTCNKPLCQRFENYESPVINFNEDNTVENHSVFNKFFQTSTPIKNRPNDNQINTFFGKQLNFKHKSNMHIKHGKLSTVGECEISQGPFSNFKKTILNQTTQKLDKINTFKDFTNHITTKGSERHQTESESEIFVGSAKTLKSTFDSCYKPFLTPIIRVDNPMANNKLNQLDENDLRLILLARKRKSDTENVFKSGLTEEKKIKATIKEIQNTPKKKVSFNLENLSYEEIETLTEDDQDYKYNNGKNSANIKKTTIEVLRNLAAPYKRSDYWYIVVDTDILLEDFEFIDDFVQTDDSCRLLIPSAIHSDIEAMSTGEYRGRHRAIVARQLVRRLAAPPPHIIVQPNEEEDITDMFTIDSILNCCLAAIEEECHVVLVTNDTNLYNRARYINVHSYNLQDIKDGAVKAKPQVSFDIKKLNNSIEYGAEYLTQEMHRIPVHIFKKQLFVNDNIEIKKQIKTHLDISEVQTSAVNNDKLINITKLKFPQTNIRIQNKKSTYNHDNDVTDTSIEIGRDLRNLILKDKQSLFQIEKEIRSKNPTQIKLVNIQINAKQTALRSQNETLNSNHDESIDSNTTVSFYFRNQVPKSNFNQTVLDFRHARNGDQTPYNITKTFRNKISSLESQEVSNPNQTISYYIQKHFNSNQKKTTRDFPKEDQMQRCLFDIQKCSEKENQPLSTNGLTKLKNINGLDIEECLKRYYVKNKTMEQRLKARMDEWICSYRQIMEDTLSDILQKYCKTITREMSPPWTLYEAMQCVKIVYGDHQAIKAMIDLLCSLLVDNNDKIKSNINPDDFMKTIGCSILLIQYLKNILPKSEVLIEAEDILYNIINNIEDLTIEPQLPSILETPITSRSEVVETNQETRRNFVKLPSDIINYLKKHYEQWSSYNEVTDGINIQHPIPRTQEVKIIRTFGKNLNLLKIDSTKSMTMKEPIDKNLYVVHGNTSQRDTKETAEPKMIRLLDNINSSLNNTNEISKENDKTKDTKKNANEFDMLKYEPKVIKLFENIKLSTNNEIKRKEPFCTVAGDNYKYTTHENTSEQSKEFDGPKVVRKVQLIATFEEILKKKAKEPLNLDVLDNSGINRSSSDVNVDFTEQNYKNDPYIDYNDHYVENNHQCAKNNDKNTSAINKRCTNQIGQSNFIQNNDSLSPNDSYATTKDSYTNNYARNNDNSAENNDRLTVGDDVTNDSGFENESLHALSMVKSFLIEISSSFKMIYKFIDGSITAYRNESICDGKKKQLLEKANKTHFYITNIIDDLKSIITRETNEGTTLKALLIKAGVPVSTDKRLSRYRQVVTKCLEQAEILQNALKMLLAVIDGNFSAVLNQNTETNSNIRFFNIFE